MLTDETTIAYAKRMTEKWGKPTRGPEGVRSRSQATYARNLRRPSPAVRRRDRSFRRRDLRPDELYASQSRR
jgi:hypothetical protein